MSPSRPSPAVPPARADPGGAHPGGPVALVGDAAPSVAARLAARGVDALLGEQVTDLVHGRIGRQVLDAHGARLEAGDKRADCEARAEGDDGAEHDRLRRRRGVFARLPLGEARSVLFITQALLLLLGGLGLGLPLGNLRGGRCILGGGGRRGSMRTVTTRGPSVATVTTR